MINSIRGTRGMAVAPHALAAQSALAVLREGGNAIEAMIAAAATIAVVYPHMNSIGGDSFWLIHVPGEAPGAIDASGSAAAAASIGWYRDRGIEHSIPFRGGVAANTVAGTVSGWGAAYQISRRALRGRLPLARLLEQRCDVAVVRAGVPSPVGKIARLAGKVGRVRQDHIEQRAGRKRGHDRCAPASPDNRYIARRPCQASRLQAMDPLQIVAAVGLVHMNGENGPHPAR